MELISSQALQSTFLDGRFDNLPVKGVLGWIEIHYDKCKIQSGTDGWVVRMRRRIWQRGLIFWLPNECAVVAIEILLAAALGQLLDADAGSLLTDIEFLRDVFCSVRIADEMARHQKPAGELVGFSLVLPDDRSRTSATVLFEPLSRFSALLLVMLEDEVANFMRNRETSARVAVEKSPQHSFGDIHRTVNAIDPSLDIGFIVGDYFEFEIGDYPLKLAKHFPHVWRVLVVNSAILAKLP
jgi:hypothetical protein